MAPTVSTGRSVWERLRKIGLVSEQSKKGLPRSSCPSRVVVVGWSPSSSSSSIATPPPLEIVQASAQLADLSNRADGRIDDVDEIRAYRCVRDFLYLLGAVAAALSLLRCRCRCRRCY